MKMHTPRCTYKNCDWVGTPKDTEGKATQATLMHIGRRHTRKIKVPYQRIRQSRTKAIVDPVADRDAVISLRPGRKQNAQHNGHAHSNGQHAAEHPALSDEVQINFCYHCGAQMRHVAEGTILAKLMDGDMDVRLKVEAILHGL